MQQIYVYSYFSGFKRLLGYSSIINHPKKEIIEKRIKIIKFFDHFGLTATKEAYNVGRSTIYSQKKKLRQGDGRLESLAPDDKTPKIKRNRLSETDPIIIDFIISYRRSHPRVGKEIITPILNAYLRLEGIRKVSESTVGRLISDLKQKRKIDNDYKLSFYAKTGRLIRRTIKKTKKLRRKGYQPEKPGDLIQIDTIEIFTDGLKRYIMTAYDIKTAFAFAYCFKSKTSRNAKHFFKKLIKVCPFKIKRVQTDNGSEFEKYFDQYTKKLNIIHFWNYPAHPKSNCYLERFNRTIQDQYVTYHLDELEDPEIFNQGLMKYLIWYNTEKVHSRLNKIPPLKYYIDNFFTGPKKSNMSWTLTKICIVNTIR